MVITCRRVVGIAALVTTAIAAGCGPFGGSRGGTQALPSVAARSTSGYRVIYRFAGGTRGYAPYGVVAGAGGSVYGIAEGGAHRFGMFYELTPSAGGTFTLHERYAFESRRDAPLEGGYRTIAPDGSGGFYGLATGFPRCRQTTFVVPCGAIYDLARGSGAWKKRVVYAFKGFRDGGFPEMPLVEGANGKLFGVQELYEGPCDPTCGAVFAIDPATSPVRERIVHAFRSDKIGYVPLGGLAADGLGNFYGVTSFGASCNVCLTFFMLQATQHGYSASFVATLHGYYPALTSGTNGIAYGTSWAGGASKRGFVFQIAAQDGYGVVRTIYSFKGGTDGESPASAVVVASNGTLYGTTTSGGGSHCGGSGCGTIFALTPSASGYRERVLYAFQGNADDGRPGPLALGTDGKLYGAIRGSARANCRTGCGLVFEYAP